MAALRSRIVIATVVALMLALFAACDRTKKVPKPKTGASAPSSEVMPRVDGGAASASR